MTSLYVIEFKEGRKWVPTTYAYKDRNRAKFCATFWSGDSRVRKYVRAGRGK